MICGICEKNTWTYYTYTIGNDTIWNSTQINSFYVCDGCNGRNRERVSLLVIHKRKMFNSENRIDL
jgi:hypothetical protein